MSYIRKRYSKLPLLSQRTYYGRKRSLNQCILNTVVVELNDETDFLRNGETFTETSQFNNTDDLEEDSTDTTDRSDFVDNPDNIVSDGHTFNEQNLSKDTPPYVTDFKTIVLNDPSMSKKSINNLLNFFHKYNFCNGMPRDYRSLLNTPREIEIMSIPGGTYI